MCHRVSAVRALLALTVVPPLLISLAWCAPPAAPPSVGATGTGYHHYRHYGHYRHWGRYSGHYRHYGTAANALGSPGATGSAAGTEDSFVKDGRRYYWHYRSDGHRYYSSHPDASDATGLNLGPGEDLEAPQSREERAARIQQAQARLAAIEKRLARQRHQRRLQEKAILPKIKIPSSRR